MRRPFKKLFEPIEMWETKIWFKRKGIGSGQSQSFFLQLAKSSYLHFLPYRTLPIMSTAQINSGSALPDSSLDASDFDFQPPQGYGQGVNNGIEVPQVSPSSFESEDTPMSDDTSIGTEQVPLAEGTMLPNLDMSRAYDFMDVPPPTLGGEAATSNNTTAGTPASAPRASGRRRERRANTNTPTATAAEEWQGRPMVPAANTTAITTDPFSDRAPENGHNITSSTFRAIMQSASDIRTRPRPRDEIEETGFPSMQSLGEVEPFASSLGGHETQAVRPGPSRGSIDMVLRVIQVFGGNTSITRTNPNIVFLARAAERVPARFRAVFEELKSILENCLSDDPAHTTTYVLWRQRHWHLTSSEDRPPRNTWSWQQTLLALVWSSIAFRVREQRENDGLPGYGAAHPVQRRPRPVPRTNTPNPPPYTRFAPRPAGGHSPYAGGARTNPPPYNRSNRGIGADVAPRQLVQSHHHATSQSQPFVPNRQRYRPVNRYGSPMVQRGPDAWTYTNMANNGASSSSNVRGQDYGLGEGDLDDEAMEELGSPYSAYGEGLASSMWANM